LFLGDDWEWIDQIVHFLKFGVHSHAYF
jgi:hypothetical protein